MFKLKKHIAFLFIVVLLTPTTIQTMHAIEDNHEHIVCKSVFDTHLHKKDLDCSDLHKILEINSLGFSSDFTPRTPILYSDNFISETIFVLEIYFTKKLSRGPPFISL